MKGRGVGLFHHKHRKLYKWLSYAVLFIIEYFIVRYRFTFIGVLPMALINFLFKEMNVQVMELVSKTNTHLITEPADALRSKLLAILFSIYKYLRKNSFNYNTLIYSTSGNLCFKKEYASNNEILLKLNRQLE